MIINSNFGQFYRRTEIEFLGEEIDFQFMTPEQLDKTIEESIIRFNQLYPPPKKPKWRKYLNTGIQVGIIGGTAAIAGGAILTSYGISAQTAASTATGALKAGAAKGSVLANVQKGAAVASKAGLVYGKVTGETPEELMKAAELIQSPSAGDAMMFIAKDQLEDMGQEIQAENTQANDALRARIEKEQAMLAEKMRQQATEKARSMGEPPPQAKKPVSGVQVASLAIPVILFMLR